MFLALKILAPLVVISAPIVTIVTHSYLSAPPEHHSLGQSASSGSERGARQDSQWTQRRVPTSFAQLSQDQLFDICQKENLKFKVSNGKGGEKWVSQKDYKSSDGRILDHLYDADKCTREVKPNG